MDRKSSSRLSHRFPPRRHLPSYSGDTLTVGPQLRKVLSRLWDIISSLQLMILAMAMLMILVVFCTFAQTRMGTYAAVHTYMRAFLVWWAPEGLGYAFPVFPGGALVGLVLTVNLVASMFRRLGWSPRKAGLWIVHAGLILLFAGEFITGACQVDARMSIEEGQTVRYLEHPRETELAIIDTTNPAIDTVFSVPSTVLAKSTQVDLPGCPFALKVRHFFPNAELTPLGSSSPAATMGVGTRVNIRELPAVTSDDEGNQTSVLVEPLAANRSYGIWLVSLGLGAPQSFIHEGHTYMLTMRLRRTYLPYAITLKHFSHDVYPGTEIAKNFSSLVHLSNPARGEERDVMISMNQPLRYDGKAFYQSSFGKGDTLSILQVVENPGWLLPYISCALVTFGLLLHFALRLRGTA